MPDPEHMLADAFLVFGDGAFANCTAGCGYDLHGLVNFDSIICNHLRDRSPIYKQQYEPFMLLMHDRPDARLQAEVRLFEFEPRVVAVSA